MQNVADDNISTSLLVQVGYFVSTDNHFFN